MAFAEDLSVFFDPETPGVVTATILGAQVNGALERDFEESLESPSRRQAPMFMCDAARLPQGIVAGTVVSVGTISYTVRDVEQDDFEPIAILHLNNP